VALKKQFIKPTKTFVHSFEIVGLFTNYALYLTKLEDGRIHASASGLYYNIGLHTIYGNNTNTGGIISLVIFKNK
jgi:hypothetical protein